LYLADPVDEQGRDRQGQDDQEHPYTGDEGTSGMEPMKTAFKERGSAFKQRGSPDVEEDKDDTEHREAHVPLNGVQMSLNRR